MDRNDELRGKQIELVKEKFGNDWKIRVIDELETIDFPDKVTLFIHLRIENCRNCIILDKQGDLLDFYRFCLVGSLRKGVFILSKTELNSVA
jgi:hypothetical protein